MRYREALGCYDKAILLDRKRAAIYHRKAEALFHLQRYDEAREAADQCLALEGEKYRPIYNNMVEMFEEARAREEHIGE